MLCAARGGHEGIVRWCVTHCGVRFDNFTISEVLLAATRGGSGSVVRLCCRTIAARRLAQQRIWELIWNSPKELSRDLPSDRPKKFSSSLEIELPSVLPKKLSSSLERRLAGEGPKKLLSRQEQIFQEITKEVAQEPDPEPTFCIPDAVDPALANDMAKIAATGGHLHLLQLAYKRCTGGQWTWYPKNCDIGHIMRLAAGRGHEHVVSWCLRTGPQAPTAAALAMAAQGATSRPCG